MQPGPDVHDGIAALLAALQPPPWHADAACKEHPDVNFFPATGEPTKEALEICNGCLVRAECFAYAVENGEHGIWGGTSRRQRTVLAATERIAA